MINLKKIFSYAAFELNKKQKNPLFFESQKKLSIHHYKNCPEYKKICKNLFKKIETCNSLEELPFVHVNIFKNINLKSTTIDKLSKTLHSSGTSGNSKSKINVDRYTSLLQSRALLNIFSSVIKKKCTFFFITDNMGKDLETISASTAAVRGFSQMSKKIILYLKIINLIILN